MNADEILDAIERKHDTAVLLREITVTDSEVQTYPWDGTPTYRRIDGLLIDMGSARTAIEVKISRSDFLRETDEKRRVWRSITHRFIYATPVGLLNPPEIPEGCGLWEVGEDGRVTIKKKARKNPAVRPIPHQVLVALAYRLKRANSALRRTVA